MQKRNNQTDYIETKMYEDKNTIQHATTKLLLQRVIKHCNTANMLLVFSNLQ